MTEKRGEDYPVAVSGTFAKRVQSIDLNKNVPIITHYELGNAEPIGAAEDVQTFGGRITWFPIDNQMEELLLAPDLGGASIDDSNPKGLLDFQSMSPTDIRTTDDTLLGVKVSSLDYALRVGGDFTGTVTVEGTGFTSGSAISITAPSGVGAYRAPDIIVTVDGTQAVRAQGFTIRAALQMDRLMELSRDVPVENRSSIPSTTTTIDFVESDSMAGNTELALASPGDIVISIGSGSGGKRLTAVNSVFTGLGPRATINGYATRQYNYVSVQDGDWGGLKIDTIP